MNRNENDTTNRDRQQWQNNPFNNKQNFGQDEYFNDSSSFRNDDVNLATSHPGRDGRSGYTESYGRNYNEEGNWRNEPTPGDIRMNNDSRRRTRDVGRDIGRDMREMGRDIGRDMSETGRDGRNMGRSSDEYRPEQKYQQRSDQRSRNEWEQNYSGMGPKGYRRSDERIEEEVCNVLMRDKNINASQIEVHVRDGVVTLSGSVNSRSSRFDAEMAIDGIPGIEDIQNDLKVKKWNDSPNRNREERGYFS